MKNVTYINASAGSGKTYTLIDKLTRLISENKVKPEQVILTTFTTKAANEFKEKAKASLYKQNLYDEANRLDQALIGTVHSVCQNIINKYWFFLGLSPNLGVMAEEDSAFYISQSLADLPKEDELECLHKFCYEFGISHSYGSTAIGLNYDFWQDHLKSIIAFATNYEITDFTNSCRFSLDYIKNFIQNENRNLDVSDNELDNMIREAKESVSSNKRIKDKEKYYKSFENIKKRSANKNVVWIKDVIKTFKISYGETCSEVLSRLDNFWSSHYIYNVQENYIKIMFKLANRWQKKFTQFKREKNLLDYNDMEKYMFLLLQNESVIKEIANSYRYLFVDEFQDSSPIQLKIFDALSDVMEHSYWVGDVKQSIYGFRGSDISMINSVAGYISKGCDGCDTYTLDTSWRSLPEIVELNNTVFGETFKGIIDNKNIKLKANRKNDDKEECLRFIITNDDIDISDNVANMVKKGIMPNDIAILAYQNKTLNDIAQNLKVKYNIPTSRDTVYIVETRICSLVKNLLHIVNSKKDELAKVNVALLTEKNFSVVHVIEKKLLFDINEDNKTEDFLSDVNIIDKLFNIIPKLKQQSVTSVVETIIIELGLFDLVKRIEDDPKFGISCLQTIINTARTYEDHSVLMNLPSTIEGFIAYLENINPTGPGDANGVQLHTYHSCKGLQWKYVILTSLDRDILKVDKAVKNEIYGVHFYHKNSSSEKNIYPEVLIRLTPWIFGTMNSKVPDEIMQKITKTDVFKYSYESMKREANRLLYVGMTRPRDVLIIDVNQKNNTFSLKWLNDIGLNGATKVTSEKEWDIFGINKKFINNTLTFDILNDLKGYRYIDDKDNYLVLSPNSANNADHSSRYLSPSNIHIKKKAYLEKKFDNRVEFNNTPSDMAIVGDCIHHIFACFNLETINSIENVNRIIQSYGLIDVIRKSESIIKSWNNLITYLTNKYGESANVYHERPFRFERDGQVIIGSIDFVWQTNKGNILIDFKTCPMGPREILNEDSKHYAGWYAGQLEAYTDALKAAAENVLVRYLYYPVSGLLIKI